MPRDATGTRWMWVTMWEKGLGRVSDIPLRLHALQPAMIVFTQVSSDGQKTWNIVDGESC
jgi:hypothetical protein